MDTLRLAQKGAEKICGIGTCYFNYDCGHSNKGPRLWTKIGKESVCPLARFHVKPNESKKPFYERPASETEVALDEIYALCATCPHATIDKDGTVHRTDFETVCLDCPVKACEETLQETAAEARCEL